MTWMVHMEADSRDFTVRAIGAVTSGRKGSAVTVEEVTAGVVTVEEAMVEEVTADREPSPKPCPFSSSSFLKQGDAGAGRK